MVKSEKAVQQTSESLQLAVLLTISGGFMDAYSYMCRGGVFANAQTGNILLLGVSISKGSWTEALKYLFPVIAFVFGIALADFVRYKFSLVSKIHWRQITVLTEAVFLLAVAFLPQELNLLANAMTSFACGAQVESFRKIKGYAAATTMCIGNLRTATQAVCDYRFTGDRAAMKKGAMFFGVIAVFVIGAVLGNFAVELFAEKAIAASSLIMLTVFFMMFEKDSR